MQLRIAFIVLVAFGPRAALLGAQSTATDTAQARASMAGTPAAMLVGEFGDDYGSHFSITPTTFRQGSRTVYDIVEWNAAGQYLIARNSATNVTDGGKWTRIDWLTLADMAPYTWAFCLSAYNAATRAEAASHVADRASPKTGCNGFPFSRMKPAARDF